MSTNALVYIHGKGGSASEADHYKALLPSCHVVGLDYRTTTPWETKDEFLQFFRSLAQQHESVSVIANSIGAYFAMNALADEKIKRAFFISPIVDMVGLITGMMAASRVTPEELEKRGEIQTPFGETLSWQYFLYAKEHLVKWNVPTHILYGGKDALTSLGTITAFAKRVNATLTVMENGEHWFHTDEQMKFLDRWFKQYL